MLTLRTPLGIEHWDFGWNLQDVDIAGSGGTLCERFGDLMRSLFDDPTEDLAERGLRPDRGYDGRDALIASSSWTWSARQCVHPGNNRRSEIGLPGPSG